MNVPALDTIPVPAFRDNYIWLIHNPARSTVAIVDPGDAAPVIAALKTRRLIPVAILVTHHHADHVGGVNELLSEFKIPVYGPANEMIPAISYPLIEGDEVNLPELEAQFRIIEVPGHTSGHIAYYGHGNLYIGDTLFMSGCGRLFEGTAAQMHQSLDKILSLPDDTRIYCAHEYTLANLDFASTVEPDNPDIAERITVCRKQREKDVPTVPGTLAIEKKTNPFLRARSPAVVAAAERYAGRHLQDSIDVFAAIRDWKDNF